MVVLIGLRVDDHCVLDGSLSDKVEVLLDGRRSWLIRQGTVRKPDRIPSEQVNVCINNRVTRPSNFPRSNY